MDGIKSKERVQQYGEVFTPDSIVNDMIDLVDNELKKDGTDPNAYIDKTWLEPACGDGQFLIRILYRKLEAVKELPIEQRPLAIVRSLSTIYGVDIQEDNVVQARERMLKLLCGKLVETFDINSRYDICIDTGVEIKDKLELAVNHILERNIQRGDTLKPEELKLTEWKFSGEDVSTKTFMLSALNEPIQEFNTVNYLDLPSRLNGASDNDEASFDDF